jgi:hypothetical protein
MLILAKEISALRLSAEFSDSLKASLSPISLPACLPRSIADIVTVCKRCSVSDKA